MAGLPDLATATDLDKFKSGDPATIVRQAQRVVRNYCRWHVSPVVEATFKLDGDGTKDLFLPTLEIVELLEVTNAGTVVDLADIDDSDAGWLTLTSGTWSCRSGKVIVKLRHGHETPPEDVVGVISAVAARMADSPMGRSREHAGQVDVTKAQVAPNISGFALMKHEKELLDPYRIPDA